MTTRKEALEWFNGQIVSGALHDMQQRYINTIRAALSEEWADISTAPRDGTRVLIWNGFGQAVVSWDCVYDNWRVSAGAIVRNPTHWMPLPRPPETKE